MGWMAGTCWGAAAHGKDAHIWRETRNARARGEQGNISAIVEASEASLSVVRCRSVDSAASRSRPAEPNGVQLPPVVPSSTLVKGKAVKSGAGRRSQSVQGFSSTRMNKKDGKHVHVQVPAQHDLPSPSAELPTASAPQQHASVIPPPAMLQWASDRHYTDCLSGGYMSSGHDMSKTECAELCAEKRLTDHLAEVERRDDQAQRLRGERLGKIADHCNRRNTIMHDAAVRYEDMQERRREELQRVISRKNRRHLPAMERCDTAEEAEALRTAAFKTTIITVRLFSEVFLAIQQARMLRCLSVLLLPMLWSRNARRRRLAQSYGAIWRGLSKRPTIRLLESWMPPLQEWPLSQTRLLHKRMRPLTLRHNEVLCYEGEPITFIFVLTEGKLTATQSTRKFKTRTGGGGEVKMVGGVDIGRRKGSRAHKVVHLGERARGFVVAEELVDIKNEYNISAFQAEDEAICGRDSPRNDSVTKGNDGEGTDGDGEKHTESLFGPSTTQRRAARQRRASVKEEKQKDAIQRLKGAATHVQKVLSASLHKSHSAVSASAHSRSDPDYALVPDDTLPFPLVCPGFKGGPKREASGCLRVSSGVAYTVPVFHGRHSVTLRGSSGGCSGWFITCDQLSELIQVACAINASGHGEKAVHEDAMAASTSTMGTGAQSDTAPPVMGKREHTQAPLSELQDADAPLEFPLSSGRTPRTSLVPATGAGSQSVSRTVSARQEKKDDNEAFLSSRSTSPRRVGSPRATTSTPRNKNRGIGGILHVTMTVVSRGGATDRISHHQLRENKLFAPLMPEESQALLKTAVPIAFNRGERIYNVNDTESVLYVVAKGVVEVTGPVPNPSHPIVAAMMALRGIAPDGRPIYLSSAKPSAARTARGGATSKAHDATNTSSQLTRTRSGGASHAEGAGIDRAVPSSRYVNVGYAFGDEDALFYSWRSETAVAATDCLLLKFSGCDVVAAVSEKTEQYHALKAELNESRAHSVIPPSLVSISALLLHGDGFSTIVDIAAGTQRSPRRCDDVCNARGYLREEATDGGGGAFDGFSGGETAREMLFSTTHGESSARLRRADSVLSTGSHSARRPSRGPLNPTRPLNTHPQHYVTVTHARAAAPFLHYFLGKDALRHLVGKLGVPTCLRAGLDQAMVEGTETQPVRQSSTSASPAGADHPPRAAAPHHQPSQTSKARATQGASAAASRLAPLRLPPQGSTSAALRGSASGGAAPASRSILGNYPSLFAEFFVTNMRCTVANMAEALPLFASCIYLQRGVVDVIADASMGAASKASFSSGSRKGDTKQSRPQMRVAAPALLISGIALQHAKEQLGRLYTAGVIDIVKGAEVRRLDSHGRPEDDVPAMTPVTAASIVDVPKALSGAASPSSGAAAGERERGGPSASLPVASGKARTRPPVVTNGQSNTAASSTAGTSTVNASTTSGPAGGPASSAPALAASPITAPLTGGATIVFKTSNSAVASAGMTAAALAEAEHAAGVNHNGDDGGAEMGAATLSRRQMQLAHLQQLRVEYTNEVNALAEDIGRQVAGCPQVVSASRVDFWHVNLIDIIRRFHGFHPADLLQAEQFGGADEAAFGRGVRAHRLGGKGMPACEADVDTFIDRGGVFVLK